jgi:hypothetical protein
MGPKLRLTPNKQIYFQIITFNLLKFATCFGLYRKPSSGTWVELNTEHVSLPKHVVCFIKCNTLSEERVVIYRCLSVWLFLRHSGASHLKVGTHCNVTAYRNAVTLPVTHSIRSYDLNFHPVPHAVTVSCERYIVGFPVFYGSQKHHECKEGERSGRWWRVTLYVQICSGRNRIIPLMRRPNTDSTPNMPVTLPRNQLFILMYK